MDNSQAQLIKMPVQSAASCTSRDISEVSTQKNQQAQKIFTQVMPATVPGIVTAFRGPKGRMNSIEHVQNVTRSGQQSFRMAIITSALLHALFDADATFGKSIAKLEERMERVEAYIDGRPTVREFRTRAA